MAQIVNYKISVNCENNQQAINIQNHLNRYGTLPGGLTERVLGALANHRDELLQMGRECSQSKWAIAKYSNTLIKIVKEIAGS